MTSNSERARKGSAARQKQRNAEERTEFLTICAAFAVLGVGLAVLIGMILREAARG